MRNEYLKKINQILLVIAVIISINGVSQIDERTKLRTQFINAKSDTARISTFIKFIYLSHSTRVKLILINKAKQELSRQMAIARVVNTNFYEFKQASLLAEEAELFAKMGFVDSAFFYMDSCLKIREKIKDEAGIAMLLNNYGNLEGKRGLYDKALIKLKRSVTIKEKLNSDLKSISIGYTNMGSIYKKQNKLNDALYCFKRSYDLKRRLNDKKGVATMANNIGSIYSEFGKTKEAIQYYYESLKIREELKDIKGQANCLNNLGNLYGEQEQPRLALDFLLKSLKIKEKLGEKKGIATSLNNIGSVYKKLKMLDSSLFYFEKSLQLKSRDSEAKSVSVALNNIATIYLETKNFRRALEYLNNSIEIKIKLNDKEGVSNSYRNIAKVYMELKNYYQADLFGRKSLAIAREIQFPKQIKNACLLLSQVNEKRGDGIIALSYYKEYILINDSLNNAETQKELIKKQFQYSFEKRATADSVANAKQIEIINAQLAQQSAEIKAKRNQQYATYGGLALFIVFSLFMYNRLKVTQRQNKIIVEQKEMVEIQKHLVEEKQKEIIDSIKYAKRIQEALITNEHYFNHNINRLRR